MNVALAIERFLDTPMINRILRPSYPTVAVEVASGRLIAIAADPATGEPRAQRMEELPPGVVRPSLLRPAVSDPVQFRAALERLVLGLPGFEGKLTLVLPDQVAKLTLLNLESDLQTAAELKELVRWRLKRSTPFRIEDARISLQTFRGGNDLKLRCLVAVILDKIVDQLESICEEIGWEVGLIDLSSFNLWNLLEAKLAAAGDCLLFNMDDTFATAMISRAGEPAFVRCKAPTSGLPVSWDRVKSELHPTILYYEDRIGGPGLRRAFVRAPAEFIDELVEILTTRHAMEVTRIDQVLADVSTGIEATDLALLAPTLGAALGR